ncbi:ankyrin repeat domain-containing protein [Micromonospora sp. NPDC003197]
MTTIDVPELPTWQRIRRYAVPEWMIEECTQRREANDWRGACAAARIDVDVDLAEVANRFGTKAAERIEQELSLLAPDLLRWHLPRALGGRTILATRQRWVFSVLPEPLSAETPLLSLQLPKTVDGSQRLRLELVNAAEANRHSMYDLPPYLWSVGHVASLRYAYGGSAERLPRFDVDGKPLPVTSFADTVDPADPASQAEAVFRRLHEGEVFEAWRLAGIDFDPSGWEHSWPMESRLAGYPFNLAVLPNEAERLARRYGSATSVVRVDWALQIELDATDRNRPRARVTNRKGSSDRAVGPVVSQRPPDLDLLWHRMITPDELHPLVRQALFPAPAPAQPAAPIPLTEAPVRATEGAVPLVEAPVRVRCRTQWHTVAHRAGQLEALSHSPEEAQREQVLLSLGGQVTGCFAVQQRWTSGRGRLPRQLRQQRQDILQRVLHGGSRTLLALLDAGLDPHLRDGRGRSFLHHLRTMDHTEVLPRLLAAGLAIDTPDSQGRTPLNVAVGDGGSPELVQALLAAGADPNAKDNDGTSPFELAGYKSGAEYLDDEEREDNAINHIYDLLKEWTKR